MDHLLIPMSQLVKRDICERGRDLHGVIDVGVFDGVCISSIANKIMF